MITLGNRLRLLRKQHGITQKALADKFKISESTIGMYERDEREPSIDMLNALADFFEVSVDYLYGRTDNPNPDTTATEESLLDPELGVFFKEIKNAPEDRQEQLRKIWEIIKSEGNRKPGDKQ